MTEAFIGVLFAGMSTSILFSKVGRIQSDAQVFFSNALCVQMSKIPSETFDNNDSVNGLGTRRLNAQPGDEKKEQGESLDGEDCDVPQLPPKAQMVPCPVIEFQVVNKLANSDMGAIVDATLKAIVISQKTADSTVKSLVVVHLEEFEHPLFQRVWKGRHKLDVSSPLLKTSARLILNGLDEKGRKWPADWNNVEKVREILNFSDLIVIITGVSNISALTVFENKRYKASDIVVGYKFAPLLYHHPESESIKVNFSLIDDLIEQDNGRAEALGDNYSHKTHHWDTSV